MRKKVFNLLLILVAFFTFNISCYAAVDFELYGFGDDYDGDDYLTLYNTRTCYVSINNIPISEKENIKLTIQDKDIAEIQDITYGDNSDRVITAKIKGKKLGTTDIIASLTYNGVNYTSKITTTVHESNYRIFLHREDYLDSEGTSMKKGESLKLVATLVQGMAWHRGDISSNGVTWLSNNENVVSVDNKGLVTAIEKGTATITAKYKTNEGVTITDSYNIEVKNENSSSEETGIRFYYDEPGPGMTLNYEDKFSVGLENIPQTEKRKIEFKIENENIAKITKTEYDEASADAIATVKYLSVGKTKLIATLNYNGKTYSDSFDLDVIESNEELVLSAKGYTDLPISLKVGEKLELTATLEYKRGSLVPKDVTSDSVIWTSSDENIAKVDNKGLVTAVGKGTVTITAKYDVEDKVLTNTLTFTIVDPIGNPNTGAFVSLSILVGGIILAIAIMAVVKKKKLLRI